MHIELPYVVLTDGRQVKLVVVKTNTYDYLMGIRVDDALYEFKEAVDTLNKDKRFPEVIDVIGRDYINHHHEVTNINAHVAGITLTFFNKEGSTAMYKITDPEWVEVVANPKTNRMLEALHAIKGAITKSSSFQKVDKYLRKRGISK